MAIENKKQWLLILFGIVAGVMAVLLMSSYITQSNQKLAIQLKEEAEASQREMVAALQQQNDQRMAALSQELERVKSEQSEVVKRQVAEAARAQQPGGAQAPVKKMKPSLAIKTPSGKRAVTVQLESLAAVGGLLNPGDTVDVLAHLNVPVSTVGDKKNTVTAMIFQELLVLAVNTNIDETGAYYDQQQGSSSIKVTVAVDPQEVGLLAFADKNGKLELALRASQETDHQMVQSSTWKTLADYVLENQGADINIPEGMKNSGESTGKDIIDEDKPSIQIFRGGKEL